MLIDTHTHLFDKRFKKDIHTVISNARQANVVGIVAVGIDDESNLQTLQIAKTYQGIVAAVGIQPNHVAESKPTDWDHIVKWAESESIVTAIGETGVDRYWDRTPFAMQEEYFVRHLELGRRLDKVVIIHCRDAEKDCVRIVKEQFEKYGPVKAVLHSYTGDAESAHACLAMGLHVSFAGMITYKTAQNLRDLAKEIPVGRLVIETDCPYLSPEPKRGKRNEPAYIQHTAEVISNERGESFAEFCRHTTESAVKLFGISI